MGFRPYATPARDDSLVCVFPFLFLFLFVFPFRCTHLPHPLIRPTRPARVINAPLDPSEPDERMLRYAGGRKEWPVYH